MIQNIRLYLFSVGAFVVSLFGIIVLRASQLNDVFYDDKAFHSIVMIIIVGLAFAIFYFAYQAYKNSKNLRIFSVSLAFYFFGFISFFHITSSTGFYPLSDAIFEITEHYSLLFASFALLGLFLPEGAFWKKVYRQRIKIIFLSTAVFLSGLVLILLFPGLAEILEDLEHIITVLAGLVLLATFVFLLRKYHSDKSEVIFFLTIGMAILVNSAIVPFFYEKWNILWWYFHFLYFLGFSVILYGMLKYTSDSTTFLGLQSQVKSKSASEEIPAYTQISTKIIFFILVISIIPLLSINYFIFDTFKYKLEQQVFKDLDSISDSVKGQVFAYLDLVESRTVDFSSDGFIRDKLKEIINTRSPETVEDLNRHLINNKKSLDSTILDILVIDLNGQIVASTDLHEIGNDESSDEYFREGRKDVFIVELELTHHHFELTERAITVAAPLTDKITGELLGVIVNYFSLDKIQKILTGEFLQEDNIGAKQVSGSDTVEVYIVDENKIMFVHPHSTGSPNIGEHHFGMTVDIPPVRQCLENGESVTTVYQSYNDEEVLGTSVCIQERGWVVLIEMDKTEVFQPISDLENNIVTVVPLAVFLIAGFGIFFSNRLTRPIESLTQVTKQIIDGDYGVRTKIKSKNEIGVLAENFNKMTDGLINAKKFSENIISSMKDSVIVITPQAEIKELNQATLELLGCSHRELIGQNIKRVVGTKAAGAVFAGVGLKKIITDGFVNNLELPYYTKDAEEIPVSISGSAIKNDTGDIAGIVIVAKDMRIYKEVERAKSEFVSIAAHQLRTPLSVIKWTLQMLLDGDFGKLNESQKKILKDGNIINNRMERLISDLLNVSRIEERKFVLAKSFHDIGKIIADTISVLKPKAKKKDIDLKYTKLNDLPKLNLDRGRIYLLLENVIENALKYTNVGGKVEITAQHVKKGVEIRVADNGMGIPEDQQGQMFSRFFRGRNAKIKETEGTGLGLYIVKDIVKKHGGRIWFESQENKGTTFYILLANGASDLHDS